MKQTTFFLLIFIVVVTTGCPKSTPVRPEVVEKIAQYEIEQLENNIAGYDCAYFGSTITVEESVRGKGYTNRTISCPAGSKSDLVKAKRLRDATVQRLIRVIDYNYFQFENDLYVKRATGSFLADAIDTGANLAATITNGERAKTIINASLIAFRGTRKSASISYFQEQTADVLITKMQTSRNRVLAEMLKQMKEQDVDSYTLDTALGDSIRYFYAGTLPRALQELKIDTSLQAKEAKDEVRKVKGLVELEPITKDERNLKVESLLTLKKLEIALKTDREAAVKRIKSIVEAMKNDPTFKANLESNNVADSTKEEDIIKAIRKIKRDKSDADDVKGLDKLNKLIVEKGKLSETEDN